MSHRRIRIEHVLYGAAFLLALLVRFANLDNLQLSNWEAELALQSLGVARGEGPLLGPHPAYLLLTAALMFLTRATDWVARFWPALAGSLLVLLPILFRGWLGKVPAVLLAFFLALDPGLLAVSRQAGSLPLALFSLLLAVGLWINGRTLLAGIATGLALLSGPAVWPGILGLILPVWITLQFHSIEAIPETDLPADTDDTRAPVGPDWKPFVLAALATAFIIGTLFFTVPTGLSAMAESLPAYLGGWLQPSGISMPQVLLGLLLYGFVPLLFGLWGAVIGLIRGDKTDLALALWWVAALVLILIYPARALPDLTWSMIPLWALAARQVARLLRVPAYDLGAVFGHALLIGVILAFVSLTLVALVNNPAIAQRDVNLRMIGAAVMIIASTGLVAWGWSSGVALRGLVVGISLVLFAYLVASAWNAGGLSSRRSQELWYNSPRLVNGDLLLETIEQLNQWGPQETGGLELAVVDAPSPALRWLLRDINRVSYVSSLPPESSPALVITPNQPELALAATYRGQGFLLADDTNWTALNPADWFRWTVFRSVPGGAQLREQVILWARLDVFPAGEVEASLMENAAQPDPEFPLPDEQNAP